MIEVPMGAVSHWRDEGLSVLYLLGTADPAYMACVPPARAGAPGFVTDPDGVRRMVTAWAVDRSWALIDFVPPDGGREWGEPA